MPPFLETEVLAAASIPNVALSTCAIVFALGRIEVVPEPLGAPLAFTTDDFLIRLVPVVAVLLVLSRLPPRCLDVGMAVI